MGLYNSFHSEDGKVEAQLKVGRCACFCFSVGDSVAKANIPDGIYIEPHYSDDRATAVVIQGGIVVAVTENIRTKWDDALPLGSSREQSPVVQAMKDVEEKL